MTPEENITEIKKISKECWKLIKEIDEHIHTIKELPVKVIAETVSKKVAA